jgi:hypothetical protein
VSRTSLSNLIDVTVESFTVVVVHIVASKNSAAHPQPHAEARAVQSSLR